MPKSRSKSKSPGRLAGIVRAVLSLVIIVGLVGPVVAVLIYRVVPPP